MSTTEENLKAAIECGLLPEGYLPIEPVLKYVDYQDLREGLNAYAALVCADKDAALVEQHQNQLDLLDTIAEGKGSTS